ncbi:hypothetical protein [Streptomyces sp. AS02]|uniref:hypothetical protein n=1 Tax=Streptomyces sp. AS02 TaxID=2938946 RepID=UPI0020201A20|nr:hypothetical protein [Streptomyces sp. AS02]MCL8015151.1 hypothetical protein [Streptomyces sp. AS02]
MQTLRVRVETWDYQKLISRSGLIEIAGGNSRVVKLAAGNAKDAYVIVKSDPGGAPDEIAVPLSEVAPTAPAKGGSASSAVPWLAGLFALIGALVGSLLQFVQSERRTEFEAGKENTARNSEAYRTFLSDWRKALSGSKLEACYRDLVATSSVPENVQQICKATLSTLFDNSASGTDKQQAADRLYQAVDSLTKTQASPKKFLRN